MNERLAAAIQLRAEKKLQQSNEQLIQLAAEIPKMPLSTTKRLGVMIF